MWFDRVTRVAYAVAMLATLLALAVRVAAGEALGPTTSLFLFALPVIAAAWLGGLRPGLLATALAALCAVYFLYRPLDAAHLAEIENQARVALFIVVGLAISYSFETLHAYRREHELDARTRVLSSQWESILGGIPSPFYSLDEDWRFSFLSDRFLELTGMRREELLGRSVWDAFPDSVGTPFEPNLRGAVAQQSSATFEQYYAPLDRWFENHVYPASTGVAVLVADITARKRAEETLHESENRFRSLATDAPAAIFIKDLEGRYTFANAQACEALGRPDGVVGLTDHDLLPAEEADDLRRHDLEVISSGQPIEREEVVGGPHGDQFFLSVKFPLIGASGKAIGVCGVALDITARKSAEHAQALLAGIVESSDDAIISKTLDGKILSWNARAERLFGYSASEAIGSPITLIVPPHRADEEEELLERLRRGERIELYETVRVSKRGRLIDVSLTASLLRDGLGRIIGASLVLRNITERKQAEQALRQSEEQLHLLSDSIPQLAWMARSDGHVFWYNKRWYEFTGTTPQQMQEAGWNSLVDPEEEPRVLETWKAALASEQPWEDTFRLRRHDGALRWHLSRALPLRDEHGRVMRWFGTNTDITELREMDEALKEADRRKDEFLATLAHELRNPLAPIRSSLQILRLAGSADPNVVRVQDLMERQVDHLVRLVDDLLDVSRITRGKIELRKERIDVATIVRNAVEVSRPAVDANRHQLAIALPPEPIDVEADVVRMAQVLANLLNNAAKFTPEGGQIWLTVSREIDDVAISVRDSGPGMSAELLPRVFDLFAQGEQELGRVYGGLGIGLTLVRSLAELHGGTAEARSDGPGKGSEFIVRLPFVAETPAPAQPPREPRADERDGAAKHAAPGVSVPTVPLRDRHSKQKRPSLLPSPVLVVDDYEDAAAALSMLLRALGAAVHVAHSGEEALAALDTHRPGVVLLDIGMPGMDGYEVARRIRELPDHRDVTLIALTGWGQETDRRRSREAGFDHHLLKPVDFRALEELLTSLAAPMAEKV